MIWPIIDLVGQLCMCAALIWLAIDQVTQSKQLRTLQLDVGRLMREYPVTKPVVSLVLQEWVSTCCSKVLIQEQKDTLMLKLKKGDVRTLRIKPVDADGNATMLDGAASWVSSDPTAVFIEANADGLSATLRVLQANTNAEISVSGDGSQGDTVHVISGTMPVHVFPADAVGIAISADNETVVVTQEVPVVDVPVNVVTPVTESPAAPVTGTPDNQGDTNIASAEAPKGGTDAEAPKGGTDAEAPKGTGTEPVGTTPTSNSDTPPPPATPGGPSGPPPSDA